MAPVKVPPDYRPSDGEPFMNDVMREYFRMKLMRWRSDLLDASSETLSHLQERSSHEPDIADRASLETDRSLELRTRDRGRKLISKIDAAIDNITQKRADFGAKQNRIESILRNNANVVENQSAARSRIRDADFARETANLTRTQILQQAGTAMLAQANQLPQSVLQLIG